ncbi:hypothetical protein JY232_03105 [Streptococcus thermophilus]|uniref:hypothetical protein n=1 Tax=Streptococcus thermophilus TaxID=1308 RepID=UPI0019D2D930|nr:hypothetical protein [Streptococcus thermophilus]MBN6047313.1 hypothetical protein [Streptococcus thermophilus]
MKITEIDFCDSNINKRRLFLAMEELKLHALLKLSTVKYHLTTVISLGNLKKTMCFLLNIQKRLALF